MVWLLQTGNIRANQLQISIIWFLCMVDRKVPPVLSFRKFDDKVELNNGALVRFSKSKMSLKHSFMVCTGQFFKIPYRMCSRFSPSQNKGRDFQKCIKLLQGPISWLVTCTCSKSRSEPLG